MRRRKFIVPLAATALALFGGLGLGAAHAATAAHPPGAYGVNVSSSTFYDPSRGTPARTGVPAHDGRTIHKLIYDPVGVSGPLPTVMFAPGWDDQSADYDPLLRTVASAGYLVVGVDSPGTSSYFPGAPYYTPTGEDIGNNTLDLSAALDDIEAGPLGPSVDTASVAAMGHSDGGSVATNLALNSSYQSPRFNAYVSLSGNVPYGLVSGNIGPINNGPILAMVGTADEYGNYDPSGGNETTEQVYTTSRASRILVTMAGATHLSGYIGAGTQPDDVRAAITNFLNVAEKQDAGSRTAFNNEVNSNGLAPQADLNAAWYVITPPSRVSGMSATLTNGQRGYYITSRAGHVSEFGAAQFYGDMSGRALSAPIISITATADGQGYYLLGADGGVFTFGDAKFYGSEGGIRLNAPVDGMAVTPDGLGYWLVAQDGGIFTFGSAIFHGSTGGMHLNQPVDGIAVAPGGNGYWLVARDGGVFTFTPNGFYGSEGNVKLNAPIIGMASTPDGMGYILVGTDGGVFTFGSAPFYGSLGNSPPSGGVITLAPTPDNTGYYMLGAYGGVFSFGPGAAYYGSAT